MGLYESAPPIHTRAGRVGGSQVLEDGSAYGYPLTPRLAEARFDVAADLVATSR